MKKICALVICLLLCLTLCGCSSRLFSDVPNPIATFTLSNGQSLVYELCLSDAPNTVANFVELANNGYYDGLKFFRVVPGVLIQSGCRKNDGTGSTSYTIQGEFSDNGINCNKLSHTFGTLSMARRENYDSASTQFFFMLGDYSELYDGKYAAFGVPADVATEEILRSLGEMPIDSGYKPMGNAIYIESVRVDTKGYSYTASKIKKTGLL